MQGQTDTGAETVHSSSSTTRSSNPQPHIVIVGGGIIGCTTAYYILDALRSRTLEASYASLSFPPSSVDSNTNPQPKVTLLEASIHGPAQGASGKAGGLLAKWAYPHELVDVSFSQHQALAERHNGKDRWGFRFVKCGSWEGEVPGDDGDEEEEGEGYSGNKASGRRLPKDLLWLRESLTHSWSPLSSSDLKADTPSELAQAQVHPYEFTTAMLELAKDMGLEYVQGRVTDIVVQPSGKGTQEVTGVQYLSPSTGSAAQSLDATHVLITAGAWSPSILSSMKGSRVRLPIKGSRAHSVTFRPPSPSIPVAPYIVFTQAARKRKSSKRQRITTTSSSPDDSPFGDPEIYARPTNEIYACGATDNSVPFPITVDDVQVDSKACARIVRDVGRIMDVKALATNQLGEGGHNVVSLEELVHREQACYLPVVTSGVEGPIVGEAKSIANGLYLGVGHTCWGICNAPGTAKALTELILDGEIRCADLSALDPSRFLQ
ncbi:FAD dependent oxidoreductase [Coprinopsis marcescibilis]|uniref:FAD dependent oxidoreductase n=1 Tax=Coprinopsis marcescibilis TaxID=230819 RepID=A0A5C3L9S3_COPMA|nr:FAD dependent oxidoreductase [Coprinopsis marcescibilis]